MQCKGMLLRHGTGKVKHLTTKQLWVQGAVQAYGMEVLNVPRAENSADILTHPTTGGEMDAGLDLMFCRELAVDPASGRKSLDQLRGGAEIPRVFNVSVQ